MLITAADEAMTIPAAANVWAAVVAPWSFLVDLHFLEGVSSNPWSQTWHSCESLDSQLNQLESVQGETVRKTGFWFGKGFPVSNVSIEKVKLLFVSTDGVFKVSFLFWKSKEAHSGGEEPPLYEPSW